MIKHFINIVCLTLISNVCFGQNDDDIKSEIRKLIKHETNIKLKGHQGLITHIIDQDTAFTHGFEFYQSISDSILQNKVFEMGSISKLFLKDLVKIAMNEGKLKLEQSVTDFLPDLLPFTNITIKHLLNHSSGLSKRPEFIGEYEDQNDHPFYNYTKDDFLNHLLSVNLDNERTYQYSHANYALLEMILEQCYQGKNQQEIFSKKIANQLKLNHSYFEKKRNDNIEPGYDLKSVKSTPWRFKSFSGSLGFKSCIRDLDIWIRNLMSTQSLINSEHRIRTNKKDVYCELGWHIIDHKKLKNIYLHTGRGPGHHTFLIIKPDTRTAVIVISNFKEGSEDLAMEILRMVNDNWNRKSKT